MKTCQFCVFYAEAGSTCRRHAPRPTLSEGPAVVWPQVLETDWCAQGYNPADGFYTQSPAVGHG